MVKILDRKYTIKGNVDVLCDTIRKVCMEYSDTTTYAIETWYNGHDLYVRVFRKL